MEWIPYWSDCINRFWNYVDDWSLLPEKQETNKENWRSGNEAPTNQQSTSEFKAKFYKLGENNFFIPWSAESISSVLQPPIVWNAKSMHHQLLYHIWPTSCRGRPSRPENNIPHLRSEIFQSWRQSKKSSVVAVYSSVISAEKRMVPALLEQRKVPRKLKG